MKAKVTPEIRQLLDRLGAREYTPADLPADTAFGRTGECFDTCIIRAMHNRQYQYVEGMAKIKGEKWALHAWLSDGTHAFDPTWGTFDNETGEVHKAPAIYIGVAMDTEAVMKFMMITEYQGVLANRWRNPGLAVKCFAGVPV